MGTSESERKTVHKRTTVSTMMLGDDKDDIDSDTSSCFDGEDERLTDTSDTTNSYPDAGEGELAGKQSRAVNRLRVCVILVLVLAAFGVSFTVFSLSRKSDVEGFHIQYEGNVDKILNAYMELFKAVGAISGFSASATSTYIEHHANQTTNFLTLPNFHGRAGNARALSGALYISIAQAVTSETLPIWEAYVLSSDQNSWIDESRKFQRTSGMTDFEDPEMVSTSRLKPDLKVDPIHTFDQDGAPHEVEFAVDDGVILTTWQTSPLLKSGKINEQVTDESALLCWETGSAVLSGFVTAPPGPPSDSNIVTSFFATLLSMQGQGQEPQNYLGDPMLFLYIPIFDSFAPSTRRPIAVIKSTIHWKNQFQNVLPENVMGIRVVLENTCNGAFTYEIQGSDVYAVGFGDHHDGSYDYMERTASFDGDYINDGADTNIKWNFDEGCHHRIRVFPTKKYYNDFVTSAPINVTFAVGMVFFYTILLFMFYDRLVESRQKLILDKATQSTAIVSSLFPKNVRDRLLESAKKEAEAAKEKAKGGGLFAGMGPNNRVKSFLGGEISAHDEEVGCQPIADLFPHCTVFFADIAGFTAWSSSREPAQVFLLLQHVYQAFDTLAKRRKVFKVETIGDSYVAVTGLPEPQPNHAIIMARFAWECLYKFNDVTRELEVQLGPDTTDLAMRFGLHSGPVTAGVLRGERARFQLFGDTVNTASRMETTGLSNRIQVSQTTADQLTVSGKSHWLKLREDSVNAKGKGVLNTYWLNLSRRAGTSGSSPSRRSSNASDHYMVCLASHGGGLSHMGEDEMENLKNDRLVDWMTDILLEHAKKIIAVREVKKQANSNASRQQQQSSTSFSPDTSGFFDSTFVTYHPSDHRTSLDEVKEVVRMPEFDAETAAVLASNGISNSNSNSNNSSNNSNPGTTTNTSSTIIQVPQEIKIEMKEYVSIIAASYRKNPFHNFQHACHVTMSVSKLLKRIVAPDFSSKHLERLKKQSRRDVAKNVHEFSHGIVNDPMAIFAITFSALIHDVDHQGVSNVQLGKERPELAAKYRGKSVAEQHSLQIAWDVLMMEQFLNLRRWIFETQEELMRFRQLIVNIVLATDMFDKELNDLRKKRWASAFDNDNQHTNDVDQQEEHSKQDMNDLRATIIIEHIIQASDVSHTMQHWHVYRKWNEYLFQEMYTAHRAGRMAGDPTQFWYKGELKFFDNYVIPLTKKLKDCNVFGVSSDEYLNYAVMNRNEWKERGEDIVKEMVERCASLHPPLPAQTPAQPPLPPPGE